LLIVAIVLGYFLGAIPFGYIVGKICGVNIMKEGSGNIGFTNTWRVLGFQKGLIVLFCDMAKGYISAFCGFAFANEWGALLAGVAAIVGHTYSIFLHFKGGKGVACGGGFLFFLSPLTVILGATWLAIVTATTRYMSLGSITAAALCPIIMIFLHEPPIYIIGIAICCAYVIWMHRSNIKRLLNGTENKIGHKKH